MAHNIGEQITRAIARRDRPGAVTAALRALEDGHLSIPQLYDLLGDVMVDMGARWRAGTTEVWQEHLATGIVRTIVEAAVIEVERQAPAERAATVIAAAPDDEYHDLGVRMLADRFTLAGWRSHFLGGALPVREAIAAVSALGADAAALSVSTHFHRVALEEYVAALRAAHPALRVWVGGAAFAHSHGGWPDEMVLDPRAVPPPEAV